MHPPKAEGAAPWSRVFGQSSRGEVKFKPRDLGNDRGYKVATCWGGEKRRQGAGATAQDAANRADMGRSVLRPYIIVEMRLREGGAEAADYSVLAEGDHGVEQRGCDRLANNCHTRCVDEEAGFYAGGLGYGAACVVAGVVIPLG
jgi:hypothetical protein